MTLISNCRVCSATLSSSNYLYTLENSYPIYSCSVCGSIFSAHLPFDAHQHMHKHKDKSTYSYHYSDAEKIADIIFDGGEVRNEILRFYRQSSKYSKAIKHILDLPKGSRVLEVGCSSGHFVGSLRAMGFDAYGQDISSHAISYASKCFGNYFASSPDSLLLKAQKFDAVICMGTVGCVESPMNFLVSLCDYVADNGFIFLNYPAAAYVRNSMFAWPSTLPPDLNILYDKSFFHLFFLETCSNRTVGIESNVIRFKGIDFLKCFIDSCLRFRPDESLGWLLSMFLASLYNRKLCQPVGSFLKISF